MRALLLALAALPLGSPAFAATEAAAPAEVSLQSHGYGWLLTDTKGMTLYTFSKDLPGKPPACVDACAKNWPALAAPADAKAVGEWSIAKRPDGSSQWMFQGKPLYTSARDTKPGEMNGDENQNQWFIATKYVATPPGYSVQKTEHGHLLIDAKRMTLYTSSADSDGKSKCTGACARTWKPAEAWQMAAAPDKDWTAIQRDDGTRQWAYKGKPLYRYSGDFAPTEIAGDKVDGHAAVILEPAPANPAWVQYHESDAGEVLADPSGKTLYAYDNSRGAAFVIGFSALQDTLSLYKPVVAEGDAKPDGYWSIADTDHAKRQWIYKGMPVFTNIRDKEPGDLNGVRRMDWLFRTLTKNGQSLAGSGL